MNFDLKAKEVNSSLRKKVKHYKEVAQEIEKYLLKNPHEWGKFQSEFNLEVDAVFRDIMNFEKENVFSDQEDKVYKLKRIFVNKIRTTFERGDYIDWSIRKPYGYAGDYKIIEDIYQNNPKTVGFDRLFDNYFMMSAIAIAVRNRKDDFKRMIVQFLEERKNDPIKIMVLASGPAREIREILRQNNKLCSDVIFDCYELDVRAIEFAGSLLEGHSNVNFIQENAVRLAFRADIHSLIDTKYDLIYSTGLFDYFEESLATRLIGNLKNLLNPKGKMIISDVRDKYSNPSVHFMEWVGDWPLVYRTDTEFREIFINAGFSESDLEPRYEQQGILQYIKAVSK